MSSELKHRRGTAAAHASFIGAQGEITVKTDTNEIVVHDGVTPGGKTGGGYMPAGTGAVATTVQEKLREAVSVLDFYANGVSGARVDPTGVIDSAAGIQAAINTGRPVILPAGTYRLSASLTSSGSLVLLGQGRDQTILMADDGITAIRCTGSQTRISSLTVRCNRTPSGTWASTAAKGIYIKNGPDSTASNPTAYVEGVYLRDVFVQRFYESVEIAGAYWVELDNVQTIHDFSGFVLNRNDTSGFTGTTLTMNKCWSRGAGETYSNVANSTGITIWDYANVSMYGCGSERYDYVALYRTMQSYVAVDSYYEYAKYGPYFHTITGRAYKIGVYFNNIGAQFSAGGHTLYLAYGQLNYSPSRFVTTDNSAQIETDGKLFTIGATVDTRTGTASANYQSITYNKGTFTPTIEGTTTAGVGTYAIRSGRYQVVGGVLHFWIYLSWSAHTGTGQFKITGLPVASANVTNAFSAVSVWMNNVTLTANNVPGGGYIGPNDTSIRLEQFPVGGGTATGITLDTAGAMMISGSYEI